LLNVEDVLELVIMVFGVFAALFYMKKNMRILPEYEKLNVGETGGVSKKKSASGAAWREN
jgi:hypothetical protein